MISAYGVSGAATRLSPDDGLQSLPVDIVWIDLFQPSREEESFLEGLLGIELPTREDMKDIEPSSRLYSENGATFMTGSVLWKSDTDAPELADIAFILTGNRLVTIRYGNPRSFALFAAGLQRLPENCRSGPVLLARLLETIADRTAEILEQTVAKMDTLSTQVFGGGSRGKRRPPRHLEDRLLDVAAHHRMVSKTRDSLGSLGRLLSFVQSVPSVAQDEQAHELCATVLRDVHSLSEHASFISGNITFLLDASLGLINVEQNAIIKIFSIASVVFLPPTLVASVYGMNFQFMPELNWSFGYPLALLLMLISAIVPFFVFRWKGWL